MATQIPLTFACAPTDRLLPLYTSEVTPLGLSPTYIPHTHPRDVFDQMTSNPPSFTSSELSLSEYITRYCAGDRTFVAIPVFPSRAFRHGYICVDTRQVRVGHAEDLAGKKIGVQVWSMTAAVWQRGLLNDLGVDLKDVIWVQGAMEKGGKHGNPNLLSTIPEGKRPKITNNETGKSLSQLLEEGEIAATIGADIPPCLGHAPHVSRLFPDFKDMEKAYFKEKGVFPIMHSIVFQRSFLEKYPFAASSLYNALCESKDIANKRMRFLGALQCMLPWLSSELEEIDQVFGKDGKEGDPWVYGAEENRKTLEALVRHLFEQGLIEREPKIEELFWDVKRVFMKIG